MQRITIISAGGTIIGQHTKQGLEADGSSTVTIIVRGSSKIVHSYSVSVTRVGDFSNHAARVVLLRGQDVVNSAVDPGEGVQSQHKLIDAAVCRVFHCNSSSIRSAAGLVHVVNICCGGVMLEQASETVSRLPPVETHDIFLWPAVSIVDGRKMEQELDGRGLCGGP